MTMSAKTNKPAALLAGITLAAVGDVIKRIDAVKGKRESYQNEVHDVAVQALAHYANNGDNTLLLRLVGGFSRKRKPGSNDYVKTAEHSGVLGIDRGWIVDWLARFSDIRFNGSERHATANRLAGDTPSAYIYIMDPTAKTTLAHREAIGSITGNDGVTRTVDLAGAAKTPYWTLEKAQANGQRNAIDLLNLFSITGSLRKRYETALQKQEEGEAGVIIAEQADKMEAYVKAMEAAHEAFMKSNKDVNVIELEGERAKRKLLAGQAEADVVRPNTTGAAVVNAGEAAPAAAEPALKTA